MGYRLTLYQDTNDLWRWRVTSLRNGRILADSGQGYRRKIDCFRTANAILDMSLMEIVEGE